MLRSTVVGLLLVIAAHAACAAEGTSHPLAVDRSEIPDLGTADQYVNRSGETVQRQIAIGILGITAANDTAELKGGANVVGVRVCSVTPDSAAARAGLGNQHVTTATMLTAGFFVAGMFFPPAALGIIAIHATGLGESYDLIIAVDGQRVRDVAELKTALSDARAGELVYLVVVRHGRRDDLVADLR